MKYMLMMNAPVKGPNPIDIVAEDGHPGPHHFHDQIRPKAFGGG